MRGDGLSLFRRKLVIASVWEGGWMLMVMGLAEEEVMGVGGWGWVAGMWWWSGGILGLDSVCIEMSVDEELGMFSEG